MHRGLAIIKEEHRALAAVLHGLSFLVAEISKGKMQPDLPLLRAIMAYIEGFPERLHHPKEDQYLFTALRRRTHEAEAILVELEEEHRQGPEQVAIVNRALDRLQAEGMRAFADFAAVANAYVDANFRHMATEEGKILPLCMRVLTDEDWQAIDTSFAANDDPMTGAPARAEFRELFTRILSLAPAPLGFG